MVGARPELVIFIGLQASGKSTWFRERFAATHEHVSKDLMPRSAKKQKRQLAQIEEALATGRSVVVDNTNPTPEARAPLIEMGKRMGARIVGVNFRTTVRGAVERNRAREGAARVPDFAIYRTARTLKPATIEEGFEEILYVTIEPPSPQGSLF